MGLSDASSSDEESVASPVCADPLVFEELGLLNHLVIVAGSSPDTLDVTFFTNDWKFNIYFFMKIFNKNEYSRVQSTLCYAINLLLVHLVVKWYVVPFWFSQGSSLEPFRAFQVPLGVLLGILCAFFAKYFSNRSFRNTMSINSRLEKCLRQAEGPPRRLASILRGEGINVSKKFRNNRKININIR